MAAVIFCGLGYGSKVLGSMLRNMSDQSHRSNPGILKRRTLERDHRCLAGLLAPSMIVLDVGCGTGAITAGIAKAVGPGGCVVGVDRDEELLALARAEHAGLKNLRFELGNAMQLTFRSQFDVVTSARALQWMDNPALAIACMRRAAKPSGLIVALDYNHSKNSWEPEPPDAFRAVYRAFLAWRDANGWDNDTADHLPDLFRSAGLVEIKCQVQDEVAQRGEPDFVERAAIWPGTLDAIGAQLIEAGFCTEPELADARNSCSAWVETELVKQTLSMRAVTGVAP
jgi:SAM-dependent methyltransferase